MFILATCYRIIYIVPISFTCDGCRKLIANNYLMHFSQNYLCRLFFTCLDVDEDPGWRVMGAMTLSPEILFNHVVDRYLNSKTFVLVKRRVNNHWRNIEPGIRENNYKIVYSFRHKKRALTVINYDNSYTLIYLLLFTLILSIYSYFFISCECFFFILSNLILHPNVCSEFALV